MSPKRSDDTQETPEKAGLFMHGMAPDAHGHRRRHIVASYTEGRFGKDIKCYGIPKGAVDPGETALMGAEREAGEETNIRLRWLMGNEAYAALLKGKTIRDMPSPRYDGVTVLNASPEPVARHAYVSGHGVVRPAHYFAVELDGIEKLRPHLKQMPSCDPGDGSSMQTNTQEWVRALSLPSFADLLDVLKTGIVPKRASCEWAKPFPQTILSHPVLPEIEARWLKAHPGRPIHSMKQWKYFCTHIAGADFKRLENDIKTLKSYLEGHGVIADEGAKLKLDTRDTPLNFYQEGGEILPVGVMLERMADAAAGNGEFERSVWGEYQGKRRPDATPEARMLSAQIAPLMEYFANIAPMEIASFAMENPTMKQKQGIIAPQLGKRGMRAVDLFLEPKKASWAERAVTPPAADEAQTAR